MSTQTVTLQMDADEYVKRGVSLPGMPLQQWAETFKALGGTVCRVSWGDVCRGGTMPVTVAGMPEAIAFVQQSIEGKRR